MKIYVSIIALLASMILSAQSYKAVYNFKWKPQQDAQEYLHEDFALLIHEHKSSEFLSYIKFRNDSVKTEKVLNLKRNGEGNFSLKNNFGQSKFNEVVTKDLTIKELNFEKQLYDKLFNVKYSCKINWKIASDKSSYLEYDVQKATTEFGGRKWTAWFTTEIPVQDGPYKFYGLPGLILKMNDSENNFLYELKSITKEVTDISERNFGVQNNIKITPEKFQKIWEEYVKQPSSIFNYQTQGNNDGWTASYTIGGGNPNDPKYREIFDKKVKDFLKDVENPIELHNSCL